MSAPPITTTSSDVTSGGQASCKFLDEAEHAQCVLVRVTTGQKGGGCGCALDGESVDLSGIALGLAGLGFVMTVRPRRRRRQIALNGLEGIARVFLAPQRPGAEGSAFGGPL